MGILVVRLKNGKHVLTIILMAEDGNIKGESFDFSDISSIVGYRGAKFRVTVDEDGKKVRYNTAEIYFEGEDNIKAFFRSGEGEININVNKITEIVSQE